MTRTLSEVESEIVRSVHQHRLMSTEQIAELHMPGRDLQWVRRRLRRLTEGNRDSRCGFLARIEGHDRNASRLWFATDEGARAAELGGVATRSYRMSAEQAAGPLQAHTLAVNDVGLAFVRAARERGDECGPLDWHHEIAHRMTNRGEPTGRADVLIPDAVLQYTVRHDGEAVISRFIELDRATMNVQQVMAKVRSYARYLMFRPRDPAQRRTAGWQAHYLAFPRVIIVLTGRSEAALEQRMRLIAELCRSDGQLVGVAEQLRVAITTLHRLEESGPFGHVFVQPHGPDGLVDVLGREASRRAEVDPPGHLLGIRTAGAVG